MNSDDVAESEHRRGLLARWEGLLTLAIGGICSFAISEAFTVRWQPDLVLKDLWKHFVCDSGLSVAGTYIQSFADASAAAPREAVRLYLAESNWNAIIVLEATIALFALGFGVAVIGTRLRKNLPPRTAPDARHLVLLAGVILIGLDFHIVQDLYGCPLHVKAALTDALSSLPQGCSTSTCRAVFWARLIGECSGFVVGIAMAFTVTFDSPPSELELSECLRRLEQLLYVASLLFVAGILMVRANFDLILAHWAVADEELLKAVRDIGRAGQVQAGVGYSALMAVFYLPARLFVSIIVDGTVPSTERQPLAAKSKWTTERGLSTSWQKDAQQLLALLAPVLSVPVFDILVK